MSVYYNEHDPYAAQWIRNLIAAGHIAPGDVDERSIEDVRPIELAGYAQCHFFAGIGGWSYALRKAGWPDDRPVWTGSCPCQPFSAAGQGKGAADERHLWPAWFHLIAQRKPGVVFGEQVEAAINHGWLDLVQSDLEGEGYAVGAVGIPAAGVGAPHIRQRLWFVAESNGIAGGQGRAFDERRDQGSDAESRAGFGGGVMSGELADSDGGNARAEREQPGGEQRLLAEGGGLGELAESENGRSEAGRRNRGISKTEGRRGADTIGRESSGELDNANDTGPQGRSIKRDGADQRAAGAASLDGVMGNAEKHGHQRRAIRTDREPETRVTEAGFWNAADWLPCRDRKARPVEPGTFPLAHGIPARVGRLRAYGNAIVPQVAEQVILAYMEKAA